MAANERKLVNVFINGPIKLLGYICGPILYPCNMPVSVIKKLLKANAKLVEINPDNGEKTPLTKDMFPDLNIPPAPPEEPGPGQQDPPDGDNHSGGDDQSGGPGATDPEAEEKKRHTAEKSEALHNLLRAPDGDDTIYAYTESDSEAVSISTISPINYNQKSIGGSVIKQTQYRLEGQDSIKEGYYIILPQTESFIGEFDSVTLGRKGDKVHPGGMLKQKPGGDKAYVFIDANDSDMRNIVLELIGIVHEDESYKGDKKIVREYTLKNLHFQER